MRDALAGASPEELQRIRDMVADLNAMLEADARGEDTQRAFEEFMERYGDMFPENPRSLEELVDALARRAAAASRLAASLSPEQRAELAALSQSVLGDLGLQYELDRLGRALRSRRPDLRWDQGATMGGEQPLGLGTRPRPWRSWPTSSRWRRRWASATRAPRWTTSTWRRWSGPWAGRPSTTSRPCAGWSGS